MNMPVGMIILLQMAAFDPDAYLAASPKPSATFDPDAYLAIKPTGPKVLPDTDTSSNLMRGIGNYPGQTESLAGSMQTIAGLAAQKMGFEDTGKSLIQKGLSRMEEGERNTVSKKSDDFTEAWEKGIGTVLTDWLPYQIGAGAANVAESLAFAGIGAGVGAVTGLGAAAVPGAAAGFLSKTLVKQGIKEAAEKVLEKEGKEAAQKFVEDQTKKVIVQTAGKEAFEKGAETYSKAGARQLGGYAGTAAQAGIHGVGEVGQQALGATQDESGVYHPENVDLSRIVPAAIVHSVADFVNERIGLGALKIGEEASKHLITDIAKRIAVTSLKETGGEEIQSIAERYGANMSLTDADALKDYINTAAASFGMAVGPGAIGGARTHLANKLQAMPTVPGTEGTQTEAQKKTTAGAPVLTDEAFNKRMEEIKSIKAATPVTETTTDIPDLQGKTNGIEAAQAQQTEAQKQEAPAATDVAQTQAAEVATPTIAPEIQAEIDRRQAKIDELRDNGANESRIKKAEDNLSAYKASVGIEGPVLSTKAALTPEQEQEAKDTALKNKAEEDARQAALKESLTRSEPRYEQKNIPEHAEELYNDTRETTNESINADNEKRATLVKQHDELAQQLKAIQDEREALDAKSDEANQQLLNAKDAASRETAKTQEDELLAKADKLAKQEDAIHEKLNGAAQALQAHGPEQTVVPAWYKLTSDEKDLYFSYIKRNTLEEHGKAAQALREYRKQKGSREGGYGQKKMSATEHRIALAYEDNREHYSKLFPVKFPRWNDLSDAAKAVFLDKVVQTTVDPITGKTTYKYTGAGLQHDAAFAALGVHLLNEKGGMDKATRAKAEENFRRIQRRIARETKVYQGRRAQREREQQRFQQIMGMSNETVPGASYARPSILPSRVVQMIKDNNLKGVLQYLRVLGEVKTDNKPATLGNKILRAVAQTMFSMDLKTGIQYRETLPGGDLAIYDPVKDVIYVTAEGMTDHVVLHEIIHAATVKVLNHYTKGELKYLTAGQIEASKQLIDIMNATKNLVAGDEGETMQQLHPRAYENIFEFVAYALTDEQMQADLANPELAAQQQIDQRVNQDTAELLSILPGKKSVWTEFKLTMAKLLKLDKFLFDKKGELKPTQRINFLMEVSAAFDGILAPSTEPIYLDQLATKAPLQAEEPRTEESYKLPDAVAPKSFAQHLRELFLTQTGHLRLEYFFQNRRAVLRKLSEQLAKSNLLIYTGDKINDIYGQITTAVADAKNYFNAYIDQDLQDLNTSLGAYARAANLTTKQALEKLHPYLEALHEPERRMVKYLLTVPLVPQADAQRKAIVDMLDTQVLTEAQAKQLRTTLDNIVFTTDAQGNRVITNNVEKLGNRADINAPEYNATGMKQEDVRKYTDMMKNDPHQEELRNIIASMQKLIDSTTELNKIGHYWSQPVSNRVAFYGWENYIPLKGVPKHNEVDEQLDFDSKAMGRELQDSSGAFGGRISVSRNPILQVSVDATRSAIRAGQRNLTLAIKNSLEKNKFNPNGQGLIAGKVETTISFADRTNEDLLKKYKGENYIFHYNDDGTIDILKVEDKNLRNAIRQTFKSSSPLIDKANMITGLIAQGHTRYNYNFGPMNFVRDALTNAFVIGAEMSPAKAAQYIKAIASIVVNGGMYKAMQVAILHQRGHQADVARLEQMGKNDAFVQHMNELVSAGGMVTHLSGLSLKSQFEELKKQVGGSGIMQKKEQFDKFVDTWTNMFEIASRTSAYMVAKQNYYAENLARGMDEKTAIAEAGARAVSFSKNLANFEQVGEWGKAMGALYMFFRPSATGAARSLQAITPAFTDLQSAEDALAPSIKSNPAALEAFRKNYAEHQRNARIMIGSLIALGFLAHTMSKMMAPDDDLGRNAVDADDMDRWTRYARFHIPNGISKQLGLGENVVFQMPWGMGLGAFAAAGAQLSAIYDGKTSIGKGLANIFGSIALDSFVPIPVSKMPITDMPLQWMLDSIAPSMARPALELALNKNGLGQAIHNEQSRRFGDAYTGGDNIPEVYKEAARGIANATTGAFDWNPNTLYFLTNTYMDGPARVVETMYGINDLAQGQKGFNPKTDIPLMGSFFGSKVNIDAQQFSAVEGKVKRIEGIMKEFATDPEREAQYMAKYPLHQAVVEFYNKELNGNLKQLRAEANEYRLNKYLSPKDRQDLLKLNTMQANVVKNEMIQVFKAYGIEP